MQEGYLRDPWDPGVLKTEGPLCGSLHGRDYVTDILGSLLWAPVHKKTESKREYFEDCSYIKRLLRLVVG